MGLPILLRHALGERTLDLPPRAAEQPVVIGRASGADVSVPSVKVSSRHAVLFVHDGYWVIQDAGSTHGTFVNGRRIDQPTYLQVGDVVTVGPDGSHGTITIDPEGSAAGRTGYIPGDPAAAATPEYAATSPAAPGVPPSYPSPAGGYVTTPTAAYGYAPETGGPVDPYAQQPAASDWVAASVPAPRRRYRRPAPPQSSVGAVIGTLVSVGIVGGAGWLVYKRFTQPPVIVVQQPAPPPAQVIPPPPPPPTKAPPKTSIFEFGGLEKQPPATATGEPELEDPTGQPELPPAEAGTGSASPPRAATTQGTTKPAAEPEPVNDPAWKSVQGAYNDRDPAIAILQFDAYAEANPGKMTRTLGEYTDAMTDRIWWQRIDQLLDHREAVKDQLAKVETEINQEPNASYRQSTLEPERIKLVERLNKVQQDLKAMGYESDKPPPLFDEEEMRRLRRDRDATYYAQWKTRVLRHIRRTHGQYPWANEK